MTRLRLHPVAWAFVLGAACGGDVPGPAGPEPGPRPEAAPVLAAAVVSQPVSLPAAMAALSTGSLVYVALPPEAIPAGRTVTIRNRSTGGQVAAEMVDGGWDPLAIAAETGDTLALTIATTLGSLEFASIVPSRKRPVVVRTSPPPGKRDVPLNATLLIVFSEPMDPASISGENTRLLQGTTPVEGEFLPAQDGVKLEFRPAAALVPGASYTFSVATSVTSRTGLELAEPLTLDFSTGTALAPARIAFSKCTEWNWSAADGLEFCEAQGIAVLHEDGSEQHLDIRHGDAFWGAAWSPDAGRIAVVGSRGGSCVPPDWVCPRNIYLMNPDGSGLTQLTDASDVEFEAPAWSPDGTRIAFTRSLRGSNDWMLYTMNADGSGATPLGGLRGLSPAWSPEGSRIAYTVLLDDVRAEIRVANADGTGEVRLTSGPTGDWAPAWSPDGRKIAFSRSRLEPQGHNTCQIFVMNEDGTNLTQVRQDPWCAMSPTWSSDGAKIVFNGGDGGPWGIMVMNADGSGARMLRRIVSDPGRPALAPKR